MKWVYSERIEICLDIYLGDVNPLADVFEASAEKAGDQYDAVSCESKARLRF
jgi:hypothetical protein